MGILVARSFMVVGPAVGPTTAKDGIDQGGKVCCCIKLLFLSSPLVVKTGSIFWRSYGIRYFIDERFAE